MSFIDDLTGGVELSEPGLWPVPLKLLSFPVVFVALLFLGWHFDISELRAELELLEGKEQEQIAIVEQKQGKAANLEPLKRQMLEIQQSFGEMVRQLPDRTAVEALLVDISQTGLAAGLEFKKFKPESLVPSEFYSTLPIRLEVYGSYHEIGEFVSGLAALPRIVTVHDVKMTSSGEGIRKLLLVATAQTYQALEEGAE